ncbi:hypothetical protein L596_000437 [Steinernema carpocapsae]|uniref:Golgin subfamily A conserved domain-containing protein n=1 Tax=Steinernema carpocapsae TaxID=34508 RepID=A0A4U8UI19_STECR|nr:hypothetical protein L596_000437 [Steinernema carpocapsae]
MVHHVAENDLSQNPQNDIEENSESNSTSVEDETETVHDDHDHCEHEQSTKKIPVAVIPEPEVIALREKLQDVTDQLETLRSENRRIVAENSEFHRIMEQNAEDENQNNIHVELGDAINRINDLNAENEQLRLELSNTTVAAQPAQADAQHQTHEVIPVQDEPAAKVTEEPQQPVASQSPVPNPQKAHEPVASVTEEKQSVGSPQWTLKELEGRLVRALEQNAEYSDKNERLEHMLIALESENDTIGEYVTLYQHQRSKIRTKRDEQIAHLTLEKMRVQKKLNELQSAVFSLLTKRGLLQSYQTGEVVRGAKHAHDGQGHRKVSKRAGKTRTFSQSISDELSGEEEVVVDSEELYLPPLPDKDDKNLGPNIDALENQLTEVVPSNGDKVVNGNVETASCERKPQDDGDIRVTKILQLLSDLQDPDAPSQPFDLNLHCKDCRGNLMTV